MLNSFRSCRSDLNLTTNSSDLECDNWKNEHIALATDLHYFNMTFAFIKINSLDDLNVTLKCPSNEYNIGVFKIFAMKNILLNNDLNLSGILEIFNRTNVLIDVLFQNLNGFNENSQIDKRTEQNYETIRSIQMNNVIFDFYRKGKLITTQDCSSGNFDSKTNFFGELKALFLLSNTFYNNPICPYVFMNTKLQQLLLNEISNSLLFRNRVVFLKINKTKDFDMNIKDLKFFILSMYSEIITLTNLNPFVFKTLNYLLINGNLEYIEENLFENFNEIRYISIKSDSLMNFFHRGTKWINSINRNLNVSLVNQFQFRNNVHKLVSIEFEVMDWFLFNQYYKFPNEDICLFSNFPHSQLVLPLLIFSPLKFNTEEECSCSVIWLVKNYKYYFYNEFKNFNPNVNLLPAYKDYFEN